MRLCVSTYNNYYNNTLYHIREGRLLSEYFNYKYKHYECTLCLMYILIYYYKYSRYIHCNINIGNNIHYIYYYVFKFISYIYYTKRHCYFLPIVYICLKIVITFYICSFMYTIFIRERDVISV